MLNFREMTDIGDKIKGYATFVAYATFIAFAFLAISQIVSACTVIEHAGGIAFLQFLLAIVIFVAGYWVAWITGLLICGFGTLVENSEILVRRGNQPAAESSATQSHTYSSGSVAPKITPAPGDWVCSCGKRHRPYETSCVCGLSKSDAMKNKN